MNTAIKSILVLVGLLAAVLIAYYALSSDSTTGPISPSLNDPTVSEPVDTGPQTPPDSLTARTPPEEDGLTRELARVERDRTDAPQGVTGRVLSSGGLPIEGARVTLHRSAQSNLAQLLKTQQANVEEPPRAESVTDAGGIFQLGLRRLPPDVTYDVRISDANHAARQLANITVFEGQWYDTGDIQLQQGLTVSGRVTILGSNGLQIPDASVSIQPVAFPLAGVVADSSLTDETDEGGYFEIVNVPEGNITITAVADGYALDRKLNVEVARAKNNQFYFELAQGMAIAGVVVDATGKFVDNARLTARAISNKQPLQVEGVSDERGRFRLEGLLPGPYEIQAAAIGYVSDPIKPVSAGTLDLQVTLERQGMVLLRVAGRNGQAVTNYSVTPKRYFPEQQRQGNLPGVQVHRVVPGKLESGRYPLSGLNPEHYVFEIVADNYAKTFSEPVTLVAGGEPPLVDVKMLNGGRIEGRIVDAKGAPVIGAQVQTLPNFVEENPLFEMFRAMISVEITQAQTKTNGEGRFRLSTLAPGTYQVKVTHPDYSSLSMKDQIVEDEQTLALGEKVLDRGTVVTGTCTVNGQLSSQVTVVISPALGTNDTPNPTVFNAQATTDENGVFLLTRRLPPGLYQATAAQHNLDSPLIGLIERQKSRQEFEVRSGQETVELRFDLVQ